MAGDIDEAEVLRAELERAKAELAALQGEEASAPAAPADPPVEIPVEVAGGLSLPDLANRACVYLDVMECQMVSTHAPSAPS